jgi:hypothetical protein
MVREISLGSKHKNILYNEFTVSKQTVMMALKYFNNSVVSRNIRLRAIELLEKEAAEHRQIIAIEQ